MDRRRLLPRLLAGLALSTLALEVGPNLLGQTGTTEPSTRRRITQADRQAAAIRAREARAAVPGKAAVPIIPPQGGIPDYFSIDHPNWAFSPPLRKFVDTLPGLTAAGKNNLQQYIPVAIPDTTTYPGSDYYEIELGEYSQQMHSDLPATRLRGYRQTNTTDATVSQFHYLGPVIVAQRDRPVRVKFTNKLPTGAAGKLFLPVDATVMGGGPGPNAPGWTGMEKGDTICKKTTPLDDSKVTPPYCYSENRATLHLHGGRTPWISDGTPHQWITPLGEVTNYKKGASVSNVPDMPDPGDGSQTFYFTNQQSSRLMFYHDHASGITRLNVYAGEAAGYLIRDTKEQELVSAGIIPSAEIPLIIQDKSFVDAATILATDPTWYFGTGALNATTGVRAPKTGDLWWPHVYVPAQNPYDKSGVNPTGRWAYGPWFWPPTTNIAYPPVPNPYYNPTTAPWAPPEMPGVPNVSWGAEAFMDTPVINGVAYPSLTVEPKAYRFRILNAAHDRFWNLQMYQADPAVTTSDGRTGTEVKMVPALKPTDPALLAAWPALWPSDGREGGVPDPALRGPDFIQIGTEGGFLPQPAVVVNQPVTWNMVPTTFNFGNVQDHALLLGPAERADVIIDFSAYAGKTLILYNDAPAAFPALDPRLDYYTGKPDHSMHTGDGSGGSGTTLAGFGPNTRTVMQIKVVGTAAPAFNMNQLNGAFASTTTVPGVFAASQDPILVGQSSYDTTYAKTFPSTWPNWGLSRIQDNTLSFETVAGTTLTVPMKPKAIHDEMGAAYDEYGRMSAKLGVEVPFTNNVNQTFILQNYIDPPTEIINESMTPMSPVAGDGTQIWKITHNGVDTHPIHFHLFDVQLINRVGWDGMIREPDPNELGWKDTVRMSPLEDTIVALRAVAPKVPFGVPESIRPLNPAVRLGATTGFTNLDTTTGQPLTPATVNANYNFGWEYVWHCHILSHEEADMMRPIEFHVGKQLPQAPVVTFTRNGNSGPVTLNWTDGTPASAPSTLGNPANEIGFRVERATVGAAGTPLNYIVLANALANATTYTDGTAGSAAYSYRVVAYNAAGDSPSTALNILAPPAVTGLTANVTFPRAAGTAITWTATATGGTPPLQYQFWVWNGTWSIVQAYSSTNTFNWTPASAGTYYVEVDVRSAGSTAAVEAFQRSGAITITAATLPTVTGLTANVTFPAVAGTPITWTATATGGTAPLQYQFWVWNGTWSIVQAYSTANTFNWTPASSGTYVVEVDVRNAGSTAAVQAYQRSGSFTITASTPLSVTALTANVTFPAAAGTPITWTATATGGTAPLQYQFWVWRGTWSIVQTYSPANTMLWTPASPGTYYVEVDVRNAGSTAAVDAFRRSVALTVQ